MISVIIPVYNNSELLKRALDSLCLQTNKKFFTIVIDDGSTEDIKSICDKYDGKLRMVYRRNEINSGIGYSRQKGLETAINGNMQYIMFLDSDDIYMPHTVERLAYEIQHTKGDVVGSNIICTKNNSTPTTLYASKSITWMHGKIYNVDFLKKKDIRFPMISTDEDLCFNQKVFWNTKKKFYIDENLYYWYDNSNSITRRGDFLSDKCGSMDYLAATAEAATFLIKQNGNIHNAIPDLLNCYNYYQIGLLLKIELEPKARQQLKEIFNNPQIYDIINSKKINQFGIKFNQFYIKNKEVMYYKQTFKEWLEEMKNYNENDN